MGEGWHYFATRLNGDGSESLLASDLPLSDVQITRTLSSVDELDATIPVEVSRLKGSEYSLFVPWSTAVYAELGGVIRAGGIVVSADVEDATVALKCDGFRGYLDGLPYDWEERYTWADPLDIARQLWSHVQNAPGGDIGLDLDVDPAHSPVHLGTPTPPKGAKDPDPNAGPYVIAWWDTPDLGSKWDDLAKDGGFDYYESHTDAGNVSKALPGDVVDIRHTLHIGYPMIGRARPDLRFKVGENVIQVPTVELDGAQYADEVVVLGAGEGRKMIRSTWPITPRKRLHRPKVVTDKSITSKAKATARAQQLAAAYGGDQDVKQLVVRNSESAPLGSWGLGDVITVQGADVGWAGDLNMQVRILSYTLNPDSGEDATLTVTRSDRVPASSAGPVTTGPIGQGI